MIVAQKWWFAPEKLVGNTKLEPNAVAKHPKSTLIKKASQFSILFRGTYVNTSYDSEGLLRDKPSNKNDLLITTTYQTGSKPSIQKLHKYIPNQKLGWTGSFFKSLVYASSDYQNKKITIQPQVYDIDSHKDLIKGVSDLSTISETIAGMVPVIAPYIGLATATSTTIASLIESLDQHDKIIEDRLGLEVTEENVGSNLLQTGHWVYFNEPQEEGLEVTETLEVVKDNKVFDGCSYVVYSIRKDEVIEPEWEIDEKVTTLMSELGGKDKNREAPIKFLRQTLDGYTKFKKINRVLELQEKAKTASEINKKIKELKTNPEQNKQTIQNLEKEISLVFTTEEKTLLDKLKSDESIKNYLPKENL